MTRTVASEAAETACAELMRLVASYRAESALAARLNIREGRLTVPELAADARGYAAIGSLVSVAEHFCVTATADRIRDVLPDQPRLAADALLEMDRRIESRWPERIAAWRTWFGIDTRKCDEFGRLLTFVEARNSILHGRGHLTRQQLGSDAGRSVIVKLLSVGAPVVLGSVQIDQAAVEGCGRCAKASILWLDGELATAAAM